MRHERRPGRLGHAGDSVRGEQKPTAQRRHTASSFGSCRGPSPSAPPDSFCPTTVPLRQQEPPAMTDRPAQNVDGTEALVRA